MSRWKHLRRSAIEWAAREKEEAWDELTGRRLSDTEFVEQQRRLLQIDKRAAWVHLAIVTVLLIGIASLLEGLSFLIEYQSAEDRSLVYGSILFGAGLGMFGAAYLSIALIRAAQGFGLFGLNRQTELLVKYHDLVKEKESTH